MPAWIGRQGGRRCAICWSGSLVFAAAVFVNTVAAEDLGSSGAEAPSFVPRVIRDPQFADAILNLPSLSLRGVVPSSQTLTAPDGSRMQADATPPQPARKRATIEERVKVVKRPSSSRAVRKAAVAALPLDRMSEPDRRRVLTIINGTSIFRELPTYRFEVDPRVYHFFMNSPDVAVGIWRVMKISELHMRQTGPDGFVTDDGAGTKGVLDVPYRGENEVVVLCDGIYKSSLLPSAIKANGALHVQVGFETGPDGKTYATHTARVFVSFPSQTVETAARIMSPVSNAIIDQNFREVSLFLHMMSRAMQRQPGWVEHVADRIEGVRPNRKTQLMDLTVDVFVDANPGLTRSQWHVKNSGEGGEPASGIRVRRAELCSATTPRL